MTVLINGVNYAWGNVTLILFGIPIKGITKISYKKASEKVNNHGAGNDPVSRGRGRNTYEASIEIYRDEWKRIIEVSPSLDPLDIPPFNIPVVFGGSRVTVQTDILQACEFMEDAFEANEGDTSLKITIPLIIAGIKHVF